jgi:PAS domain S-box-containing protein
MVQMLGYSSREELMAVNAADLYMDPEARELWQARLKEGLVRNFEVRLRRSDGEPVWVRESCRSMPGGPGGVQYYEGAMEDITELKRAEEALERSQAQLLHSQKMEAIGRLAGGIAHDFNNLLMVISGYSELLLVQAGENLEIRHPVDEMVRAVQRATALTGQLLAFGRRQILVPRVMDLNTIVTGTHEMLQRLLGEDIELRTAPGTEVGQIRADSGQLEQVILNLAINARDAMPDGGRLTIETASVYLDEAYCKEHPDVRPGAYVMLAVSDTGSGIDQDVLPRIFEPFFTTKEAGRGSGLGLSTVYGIVQQSGGTIWVYSEPGQGSTFKIYLPRVEAAPASDEDRRSRSIEFVGSGTVLLVEDDATVRGLMRKMLTRLGYDVLEGASGAEAIRLCQQTQGRIEILLTDVVMPGMGGRELARRARELLPDIKVLYMSGYTDGAISERSALEPGAAFLEKPFAFGRLCHALRELMG